MSKAKREKLRRRVDSTNAELRAIVDLPEWDQEAWDAALDRSLKATNEFLSYPKRVDWNADPNGSVLICKGVTL